MLLDAGLNFCGAQPKADSSELRKRHVFMRFRFKQMWPTCCGLLSLSETGGFRVYNFIYSRFRDRMDVTAVQQAQRKHESPDPTRQRTG